MTAALWLRRNGCGKVFVGADVGAGEWPTPFGAGVLLAEEDHEQEESDVLRLLVGQP